MAVFCSMITQIACFKCMGWLFEPQRMQNGKIFRFLDMKYFPFLVEACSSTNPIEEYRNLEPL